MSKIKVIIRKIDKDFIKRNYDVLMASLYKERREAIKTIKYENAAYESLAAGRLLQDVAGRELGLIPEEISISRGINGKPYIEGYERFRYNISHSGNYVVLAYGSREIGVDIESVRGISEEATDDEKQDYQRRSAMDLRVAERFFCSNELDYIKNADACWFNQDDKITCSDMNINFTLTWTMKESFVKLEGCGITAPLSDFEIDYAGSRIRNKNAFYEYFQLDNYIVCVCAREPLKLDVRVEEEWITCLYKDD